MQHRSISLKIRAMSKEGANKDSGYTDHAMANQALNEWYPNAKCNVLQTLKGGFSGARVYLIDVISSPQDPGPLSDGTYVLKLDKVSEREGSSEDEAERHNKALLTQPAFSSKHIPNLIRHFRRNDFLFVLYDVAGHSFRSLTQCFTFAHQPLAERLNFLSKSLLTAFSSSQAVVWNQPAFNLIESWLSYRTQPDQSPLLHETAAKVCGNRRTFVKSLHFLANPLELCLNFLKGVTLPISFQGLLHGDLHGGNVLWDKDGRREDFWIIDFALAREGSLMFDHAYMECFLAIEQLPESAPARLLSMLESLDARADTLGAQILSSNDLGLRDLLKSFRDGIFEWQTEHQKLRKDAVHSQWLLAQTCAGLNWANKNIGEHKRILAFCYAAHAARAYLQEYHAHVWQEWTQDIEQSPAKSATNTAQSPSDTEWHKLWNRLGGFRRDVVHILVTGPLNNNSDLSPMGLLPWRAVFDFDPNSDSDGLLKHSKNNIERLRSLHVFGTTLHESSQDGSTSWMMSAGYNTIHEASPSNLREWRSKYKQPVSTLIDNIRSASSPRACVVIVLLQRETNLEPISRTIEEVCDAFGPSCQVLVCCRRELMQIAGNIEASEFVELDPVEVAQRMSAIYGEASDAIGAFIPSVNGPKEIDIQTLVQFEEDIDILHSRILATSERAHEDAFWRGAPPNYFDINNQAPVPRAVENELVRKLVEALRSNLTVSIEFPHSPGAGGTTSALVAAWAVREQYPTAILKRRSKFALDRVSWLFGLAGLPVLLVVDGVLSRNEVDDLVQRFSKDNVRVVILRVVRVSETNAAFGLFDPMPRDELRDFCRSYAKRTTHLDRIEALNRLSAGSDRASEALHSPFFIGLTAFEEQFTHISEYVRHYIGNLDFKAQPFIRWLSLLGAFSQSSMSVPLALQLIDVKGSHLNLSAEIGSAAARLVVTYDDSVKIVHPLIARELMIQMLGGDDKWKYALADVCIEFVNRLISTVGGSSIEMRNILRALFIEREDWGTEASTSRRELFSPVIQLIPTEAGRARLFEALTDARPEDPHFWNHRGRHHAYADTPNYRLAEQFLERAVQLSDKKDPVHIHSLGMSRRLWVNSIVRELYAEQLPMSPQRILDAIGTHVESALNDFNLCRKVKPEMAHGYVTAIQTVLYVADELTKNCGGDYASASSGSDEAGIWLRDHLTDVETLLYELSRLRGANPPDSYETSCLAKLSKLYGNFSIIRKWENMVDKVDDPPHMRRAIASLYLAKRNRRWNEMEPKELRRIVNLLEDNLRSDATNERDIRMWFQAYHRLPEFNYYEATERLESWSKSGESVEAFYYLYIVNFLRWRVSGENAEDSVQSAIRKCDELKVGQRGYSFEWLAHLPAWCPLASANELGVWDKQKNFFRDESSLAFVEGTIEQVKPQRGLIRLGRVLRAFFVPPPDIRESSHINQRVHFHLGFSYEGFRAWNVRLGSAPVSHSNTQASSAVARAKTPTKLWVGGLPTEFSEHEVKALFETCGRVDFVKIPLGPNGRTKGFALLTMTYREDADRAIREITGRTLARGRRLEVRFDNK